ncbi:20319_t:CDS:2, partial [Dentiscutata erythropus]
QQNRFLYDSNSATTMNTTPATLETFATEDQIYLQQRKFQLAQQVYNNQTNNQLGRSFSQYTSSKANPQYICGVITATTGQPCRRAVTAEGE